MTIPTTIRQRTSQQDLPFPQYSLSTLTANAVELIQKAAKGRPYYGCFSGGKDSIVIKELARLAGVDVRWVYNVTGIYPPELVAFIREHHSDVEFKPPKLRFFQGVTKKNCLPTQRMRWCCEMLKESRNPLNVTILMGLRAAESVRRAKAWSEISILRKTKQIVVNPIFLWRDSDVWKFIAHHEMAYCALYDEGFHRLGCIGCPMGGEKGRKRDFKRWPRYENAYKRAMQRLWDSNPENWVMKQRFDTWEQMWDWWLSDDSLPERRDCNAFDILDFMT